MSLKTTLWGAAAAVALTPMAYAEGERGRDGQLSIIYWQAPSILNTFLSGGTKDTDAAALVIEPLVRYDENAEMVPWLVEEIPTLDNGGISEDLKSITWKITPGILWSDGTPFTAKDVKFTADYCMHPEGGCAQLTKFEGVDNVEIVDDLTVKVNFKEPTPFPYGPFVGMESPILQAEQFKDCMGSAAPSCSKQNFKPIGTGPFKVVNFKPNDVVTYEANENYRIEGKPAFGKVTLKGGGDTMAAARAVLETGEFDYAWNMQLAPEVLEKMEAGGKGKLVVAFGTLLERIMLNQTNPSPSLSAEERSVIRPHPFLSDPAVYKALSMAIDRQLLVEVGYGKAGKISCNWIPAPESMVSDTFDCSKQDIEGANKLLDDAGWVKGADGIREKDGVRLSMTYQTSTNAVRQDFQALIKQWWSEIGVDAELRNVDAAVFFGGDAASPDTFQKFYADVEMYANNYAGTNPQAYLGNGLCSTAPSPKTQWQGENISRFCDEEYDAVYKELTKTADLDERAALVKKLNDIIVGKGAIIPLVHRGRSSSHSNTLGGVVMNAWDTEMWNVADWYRIKD